MSYNTFTLPAPAKLNLFLHITGKRDDGYHTLQSLMVFLDMGDRIEFKPYDSLLIDVDGPFGPALSEQYDPRGNLIFKAAQKLAAEYRAPCHAQIRLTKNLPVASGLGGGSSDAAATLKGLARLWDLPEEPDRLQRIGQTLGADVPACLIAKPVWAEGIGEKMMRLPDMPPMHFALVNPMVPTPTAEVFAELRGRFSPPIQFMGRRKSMQEWIADLKIYRNDLTDAAIGLCPEIRTALQSLEETPNCHFARLSGSGATCFGVYDSAYAAMAAVNKLRLRHPDWWIAQANIMR